MGNFIRGDRVARLDDFIFPAWWATPDLRFERRRRASLPDQFGTPGNYYQLQQRFRNSATDESEWRDVPIVERDQDGE